MCHQSVSWRQARAQPFPVSYTRTHTRPSVYRNVCSLSEEMLRAEEARASTKTGGSTSAIKLSIIQLESVSAGRPGEKDASQQ